MAVSGDRPVAFCGLIPNMGFKNFWRITRLVTLPGFQGIGAGGRLMDWCAQEFARQGKRVSITASHPAIRGHCEKSLRWKLKAVKKTGNKRNNRRTESGKVRGASAGRAVFNFEFLPSSPKPRRAAA